MSSIASPSGPSGTSSSTLREITLKKASSACKQCQTRKSKCTGGIPCDKCRIRGTDCIIDETLDGRRRVALKKKQQEWESGKELLSLLINALRSLDEEGTTQLLNVIRTCPNEDEVKTYLEGHVNEPESSDLTGSPGLSELLASESRNTRERLRPVLRSVMNMNRLVDQPLFSVPAMPWTSVTNDRELVSHLVSLWFTWCAPWQNWIDRDLFLRDMRSERLDSQFCSPFLVNAMLAHACPYSDFPEARSVAGAMSDTMKQFLLEAKHFLDEEAGRVSLTTLQGLGILYTCVSSMGKDRQGWVYLKQLADMPQELYLSLQQHGDALVGAGAVAESLKRTWWGLWLAATTSCVAWRRPLIMKTPSCERPTWSDHDRDGDLWKPYPQDLPPVLGHTSDVFDAYLDLMPVIQDLSVLLFGPTKPSSAEFERDVDRLRARLGRWYETLPASISITAESPFQIIFLHLYFHHITIILSSFLKGMVDSEELSTSGDEDTAEESLHQAHALCISSAVETAKLLRHYRNTWGASRICDSVLQWVAAALFVLVDEDLRDTESRSAYVELCIQLRSLSRRWYLGKGIFRAVQLLMQRNVQLMPDQVVPTELRKLLEEFDSQLWFDNALNRLELSAFKKLFSSSHPILAEEVKLLRQQQERESDKRQDERTTRDLTDGERYAHVRRVVRTPVLSNPNPQSSQGLSALETDSLPIVELDRFLERWDPCFASGRQDPAFYSETGVEQQQHGRPAHATPMEMDD